MIPLLPEKHVRLNETLLGLGALVLEQLPDRPSLDSLWEAMKELKTKKRFVPERVSFDDLILVVDVLFTLRAIDIDADGNLVRCA